jgi:hypothetical protein
MSSVQLREVAQARSGDKGNTVDLSLFAPDKEWYEMFVEQVTAERVKQHFAGLVEGEVRRYEVPNVLALKFVCTSALNGGGSSSIRMDNLGKCFGANLLRMEIKGRER